MNWALFMWVFAGLVLISKVTFSSGDTDMRDVMAINALYIALGYPPLTGWLLVGGDPCADKWQGVDCVFSNITAIRLSGINLGGQLGNSLESFKSIMEIDFSNNHIGGSIPPVLPPTLRILSLNNNFFSGGISDAFQQLPGLTNLELSSNNLTGQLPPSMGNLSSLNTLHLDNNQLSGTLDVLQDLPVMDLNIENNLFSGPIPAKLLSISNFRKDGNPFNTTVIPAAPAPSPSYIAVAPSSEESPVKQANGPSGSQIPQSDTATKPFTAKRVTWIAIIGVSIIIAMGLCLCVTRCLIGRKERKKAQRHDNAAFMGPREMSRSGFSLQRNNDIEKDLKENVLKPLDRSGVHNRRTAFAQDKQEMDANRIATASSIDSNSHEVDILPPPPPPFLVEKVVLPTSRRTTKILKSSSVEVFSIATLQQYTNSFSQENFIGKGMLGSVYKANLPGGKLLAVKKLDATGSSQQTDEEFLELVASMSKIHHTNIVELVGYCCEHDQRLLVFKYCENGTLYDALHADEEIHHKLSWNMRIKVALGAARALEYLHEVCQPPFMHRNFKSANLLLDGDLKINVSDCGLAPLLSAGCATQLSGRLFTDNGYLAPEFESGNYTYQSDVYSFGVVMLELLTGRKSCDRSRPQGEQFLVRWAIPQLHDIDALSRMVDPSLSGMYPVKSLSRFADVISSCLQREPEFRPPMSEVVQELLQMI